jgi:hypothetical protein
MPTFDCSIELVTEFNFEKEIQADSEEEAENLALEWVKTQPLDITKQECDFTAIDVVAIEEQVVIEEPEEELQQLNSGYTPYKSPVISEDAMTDDPPRPPREKGNYTPYR